MAAHRPSTELATHAVSNQPLPLEGYNACTADNALREALAREGAAWALPAAEMLGEEAGSARVQQLAEQANRYPPELRPFDRHGRRIDEVEFHPAYHQLMAMAMRHRVHSIAWTAPQAGGHVAHAAMLYLMTQAEAGVCCPMAMTYAAIPTLWHNPALAEIWEGRLLAEEYDPRSLPATEKTACTCGMAMTEKQGGSDLRATQTRAVPDGHGARLRGHKWFCSAPMSDAFITLAQTDHGLGCFLVPRWRPDGSRNGIQLQRLKDKLGNRSNASAEIEYHDAWAFPVGDPGRGVQTIIDMLHHTRLDATVAATGLMRQALVEALHHCRQREAFGKPLAAQPLMAATLADLALEVEAALLLAMRVARYFDAAATDSSARPAARLAVAIAKFWVCKRAPMVIAEAMECLGGSGYVEESPLPRLFRESPLNGIWEGSGNVICLDVLRTASREPAALEQLIAELDRLRGDNQYYDAALANLPSLLAGGERAARVLVERLAVLMQAALLLEHAPAEVADTFCASRLAPGRGSVFGALPNDVDCDALLQRAFPRQL